MSATTEQRASERITAEVTSWDGIEAGTGMRGEFAFRYGAVRSATSTATTPPTSSSPRSAGRSSPAQGRITPHPVFPERHGPAARRIESDADIEDVIALMRINYDDAVARFARADERRERGDGREG